MAIDGLNRQIGDYQGRSYMVRLCDASGPRILPLPAALYSTTSDAVCGSWCTEKHRSRPLEDTSVETPPLADSLSCAVLRG